MAIPTHRFWVFCLLFSVGFCLWRPAASHWQPGCRGSVRLRVTRVSRVVSGAHLQRKQEIQLCVFNPFLAGARTPLNGPSGSSPLLGVQTHVHAHTHIHTTTHLQGTHSRSYIHNSMPVYAVTCIDTVAHVLVITKTQS